MRPLRDAVARTRAQARRLLRAQAWVERVARGWKREGDRFESITLISPHPDASLARLEPGTMIIRLTIRD